MTDWEPEFIEKFAVLLNYMLNKYPQLTLRDVVLLVLGFCTGYMRKSGHSYEQMRSALDENWHALDMFFPAESKPKVLS